MKFGGQVRCVTRKNLFNFGVDPDLDEIWWTGSVSDKEEFIQFWCRSGCGSDNFLSDCSLLRDGAKTIHSTISEKVVDGFG